MKQNVNLYFVGTMFLLFSMNINAQIAQVPLPDLVQHLKASVVSISAKDDTILSIINGDTVRFESYATGAIINVHNQSFILTNEHVIAIKDSIRRTVRYARDITVTFNVTGGDKITLPAYLFKADEAADLVALRVKQPPDPNLQFDAIPILKELWKDPSELREGEAVLYTGFPYNWGNLERNYPLSRVGIIAQLIPGNETFLIDAFVHSGYSGSPVFVIREEGNNIPPKWQFYFIGLAQSYPAALANVYGQVRLALIPQLKAADNPGFTRVVSVALIRRFFDLEK